MEARAFKVILAIAAFLSIAATHRTKNFVVTAPTPEIAVQVANAAEHFRRAIAIEWLGRELPSWYAPCPVQVKVGQIGAGGATSFSFDRGQVFGWNMSIQGSLERILDSVLPHEVSHTIFACYFRRPLPRWADEGAATLAEHESEKRRQVLTCQQIIRTSKRIPLRNLVAMKDYPPDMQDVLTLYAEGYSLAELLVQQGGRARYLAFLVDAQEAGWDHAIEKHYAYKGLDALEKSWHEWIMAGSPAVQQPAAQQVAEVQTPRPKALPEGTVIRGQSPDADPFLAAEDRGPDTAQSRNMAAPLKSAAVHVAAAPQQAEVAAAAPQASNRISKKRSVRQSTATSDDLRVDLGAPSPPSLHEPPASETSPAGSVDSSQPNPQNGGWEPVAQQPDAKSQPNLSHDEAREMPPEFNTPPAAAHHEGLPEKRQQKKHARSGGTGSKSSARPSALRPSAAPPKGSEFMGLAKRRAPQWSEFPQDSASTDARGSAFRR